MQGDIFTASRISISIFTSLAVVLHLSEGGPEAAARSELGVLCDMSSPKLIH